MTAPTAPPRTLHAALCAQDALAQRLDNTALKLTPRGRRTIRVILREHAPHVRHTARAIPGHLCMAPSRCGDWAYALGHICTNPDDGRSELVHLSYPCGDLRVVREGELEEVRA